MFQIGRSINISSAFFLYFPVVPKNDNPCQPSPCGPYSQCREVNGHAVCSCQTNFIGSAPNCRPECIVSSDCAQNMACQNQKCIDPCPGTCGLEARCQVINHYAACSCPPGYTGDPFNRCTRIKCKKRLSYRNDSTQMEEHWKECNNQSVK